MGGRAVEPLAAGDPRPVAGGVVYAGGNDYKGRALRASDGSELWDFAAGGPVESQIAAARRTVYAGSNDGKVYALTG